MEPWLPVRVYICDTPDNWNTSSILPMSGSGTTSTATIPAQTSGTAVKYYILTSGDGMTIAHDDADWYTINGNNNGGVNYQYTVLAGSSAVTVTPSLLRLVLRKIPVFHQVRPIRHYSNILQATGVRMIILG
ncbi:MAG: hypothetical protein IPL08_21320 [Saprospiraceae bacterium]|nr:hypothetical protein [Saprospiraceae bacterium]